MYRSVGVLVLAWTGAALSQTVWRVDGQGGGDHETIQAAIEAAQSGDRIAVAPGTYRESVNFQGKAIRLYSLAGAEATVIDGTGHAHVVQCISGEGADTILEGFTITGGNADGYYDSCGGGLFSDNSSPTVTHCTFTQNSARYGGAVCGNATVTYCTFRENSARMGGGLWRADTVAHSTFLRNTACMGGAIQGVQTVTDCTFVGNEESIFEAGTVANCTFHGTLGSAAVTNAQVVTNCTFLHNEYAGVVTRLDCQSLVTHCTFFDNGIGVTNAQDGLTTMVNCIIQGNLLGAIDGPAVITFSNVEGGWQGEGNIDADPLFADTDGRLSPESPCIDAGTNNPLGGLPSTDIEGHSRSVDGNGDGQAVADMGAYERSPDPVQRLEALVGTVADLKLSQRTNDTLMGNLEAARTALAQRSATNDLAATILLTAFIDSIKVWQGKIMAQADADTLIAAAQKILDLLAGG